MIRIRCKAPPKPARREGHGYPLINGILPQLCDCTVHHVTDDGAEHEITNVRTIRIEVRDGGEPVRAWLEFFDVEIDVEAVDATLTKEPDQHG